LFLFIGALVSLFLQEGWNRVVPSPESQKIDTLERATKANIEPDLNLFYRPGETKKTNSIERAVILSLGGEVGVKDVWVKETAFLLKGDEVYHASLVPSFEYFVWNGSTKRMFDMEPGDSKVLKIEPFQAEVVNRLHEQTGGKIILLWTIRFKRNTNGKEFVRNWYFTFREDGVGGLNLGLPVALDKLPSGVSLQEKVERYLHQGPTKYLVQMAGQKGYWAVSSLEQIWVGEGEKQRPWETVKPGDLHGDVTVTTLHGYQTPEFPEDKQDPEMFWQRMWIRDNDTIVPVIGATSPSTNRMQHGIIAQTLAFPRFHPYQVKEQ
jgi:hypothetical protein